MKRRTLIKQFGAAGTAIVGFSGSATAVSGIDFGIERQIDVADLEGTVELMELLDDADLEALNDDVDPTEVKISVPASAGTFDTASDCHDFCTICCGGQCFCPGFCCCINCRTE